MFSRYIRPSAKGSQSCHTEVSAFQEAKGTESARGASEGSTEEAAASLAQCPPLETGALLRFRLNLSALGLWIHPRWLPLG